MESVKLIKVPKSPVCHICGNSAKIYHAKKWWCKTYTEIGEFNIKGHCNNDKLPKV